MRARSSEKRIAADLPLSRLVKRRRKSGLSFESSTRDEAELLLLLLLLLLLAFDRGFMKANESCEKI